MGKMILNGEIKERKEIRLDVDDRGYQFGDGIYEVIRIYNGTMFAAEEHLTRLLDSAKKIRISVPYTVAEMAEQLNRLIKEDGIAFGTLYMQFTRGVSARNHAFPGPETNPVYIAYTKNVEYKGKAAAGVKALTEDDIRWLRCDIKSLNLLGNILAKQKASESGCFEAILHRSGRVTEGSSSNVSIVSNGTVLTHPSDNFILNGISRQVMLKLCKENGIPFEEKPFTLDELLNADEVFLTGTTIEVAPVAEIDGKAIGSRKIGKITGKLQQLFEEEIERQCGSLAR
ncbi:D-amino-acid transaminase [Bacillus sp. MUM 13]|uniref:D-amino-acid transaminase n=1 Tax=Bacillus sp. MUM 13 TaxID=1678001 RepID=UPI0008F5BC78|nr:D-amino-acid transaminase [Bacillus sp. MUM 13]OIK09354.1 D-amino-acid transaminase [Bacillus sp. MUM 13]